MVVANANASGERGPGFEIWRERVERCLVATLGRDGATLEDEIGPLPFQLGWESGDSAEEFVVAAVLPLLDEADAEVILPAYA